MIRQKIIDSIVNNLKTISSDNGFYSEAGKSVFEWLEKPLEKHELPAIVVRDVSDDVSSNGSIDNHSLKIEIDILSSSGKHTVWNLREVTSDVIKAFNLVEKDLNFKCEYKGSDFLLEQKETSYAGGRLEFYIFYQSKKWEQ